MEKEDIRERLIKNSFWSFISTIISRVGALAFTIILARFLTPENYGIYTLVLSTSTVFYTIADLGINQTLIRYLSLATKENKKQIPAYYKYLLKIKLTLASTSSLLLLILSYPIAYFFFKNPALFYPLLVASFYIFFLSLDMFHSMIFYAIEKVKYVSIRETLDQTLRIFLAILVFYFVIFSYQVIGIFLSLALVSTLLIIYSLYYIKKLIPQIFCKSEEKIDKKGVKRFVGFLTIASISAVFFSHIDSIMLGLFLNAKYVGYYGAAFSLILGVIGIVSFPIIPLLPMFTKINKTKAGTALNKIFSYLSIITIPAIFGLLALGKYFIKILYGNSYLPATLPLYFLSFLIFPVVSIGIFLSLFSAEEKPQIFAKLIVIACIINVILNFVLIKLFIKISPEWAIAGAAIATLISWFFYFMASLFALKKEFNLSLSFSSIIKPLLSSIIMFGALYFSLNYIRNINAIVVFVEILFGIIIYFSIMIFIKGVRKTDLEYLRIIMRKTK